MDKIKNIKFLGFLEVFKNPMAYISALGFISFLISMILAGISIFEIKKICVLCVFTYFLNLVIAVVATDFKAGILNSFKLSIKDFIDALKIKKYLISFLVCILVACGFLAYTSLSYVFTPQVKTVNEFKKYEKMSDSNPFKVSGNLMGDKDGKLTVYIYTDYRCPICRTYNVITSRAAVEMKGFKIVHRNLPLDMECNKNLKSQFHEGSCMLSKYSIAAEKQGRLWDLNSELFEKQPQTEADVLDIAKGLGLDTIKLREDANSEETKERLQQDIESASDLRIDGTPTLVINGKIYSGIKPYYELKEILMKAGAVDKVQQ